MRTILLSDRELHTLCEEEEGLLLRPVSGSLAEQRGGNSSPYGTVGETLQVQERLWISTCGKYYAQDARCTLGMWLYDAITLDGATRYLTGWSTSDVPSYPYIIHFWGNKGHYLRNGRYIPAFALGFTDYSPIREHSHRVHYNAEFHQRLRGHQMPKWAERLQIKLMGIEVMALKDALRKDPANMRRLSLAFQEREGNIALALKKNPLVWVLFVSRVALKDFTPNALKEGKGMGE